MSRRRYISTDASVDSRLNTLASLSDFAALMYVLMIPHADDKAMLHGDTEELMAIVMPMRRDKEVADFTTALEAIHAAGLVEWDQARGTVAFPIDAFYRYQTYIKPENRRTSERNAEKRRETPNADLESNAEDRRESAQKAASFSVSVSPSSSSSVSISASVPARARDDAPPDASPTAARDLGETIIAALPEKFRWDDSLRDEIALFAADFAGHFEDTANAISACRRAQPRELPFPGNLRRYMPEQTSANGGFNFADAAMKYDQEHPESDMAKLRRIQRKEVNP